jgi:hypothetical protein
MTRKTGDFPSRSLLMADATLFTSFIISSSEMYGEKNLSLTWTFFIDGYFVFVCVVCTI